MGWAEIISLLGGGAGIGTLLWYAINLTAKRKREEALTQNVVAESERSVSANWQTLADRLEKDYTECKDRCRGLEVRVLRLEQDLNKTLVQKHYAEFHICTNLECDKRRPPLGNFQTPDHNDTLEFELLNK